MDAFLWICIIVLYFLALAANVKLLYFYEHPDDKGIAQSALTKALIVLSLSLAWLLMLLLPVDVYNSHPVYNSCLSSGGSCTSLNMKWFWASLYIIIGLFLIVPIPFASYMYEADDDPRITKRSPWMTAMCYTTITAAIISAVVAILYAIFRHATVPANALDCDKYNPATFSSGDFKERCKKNPSGSDLRYAVSFEIFLVGIISFCGWFLFVIFGGVGLAALPCDLILSFVDRPKPVDLTKYAARKKLLGERATKLQSVADDLKAKEDRLKRGEDVEEQSIEVPEGPVHTGDKKTKKSKAKKPKGDGGLKEYASEWVGSARQSHSLKTEFNKFKQAVYLLEREFAVLELAMKRGGENIVVSVMKLCLGIGCAILSICWFLHILLYNLISRGGYGGKSLFGGATVPVTTWFNEILIEMDKTGFFLLSLSFYALLMLYLLAATIKGCMKMGLRVFIFFPIHPMREHGTHLNSFLFNVQLILLASTAIVQFSQEAFSEYANLTTSDIIFGHEIKYLDFFRFFFANNIFVWLLLGWSVLATIYLALRPREKSAVEYSSEQLERKMDEATAVKLEKQIAKQQKKATTTPGGKKKRSRQQLI